MNVEHKLWQQNKVIMLQVIYCIGWFCNYIIVYTLTCRFKTVHWYTEKKPKKKHFKCVHNSIIFQVKHKCFKY